MFVLAGFIGLTSLAPPHIARFIERRNLAEKPLVYWGIHVVNVLAKGGKLTYRLASFGFALEVLLLIFAPLAPLARLIMESVFIEASTTALAEVLPLLIFIGMIIGAIMLFALVIRSVGRHEQETKKSSWSTFASSRGLTFVPGKFGQPESYVTGTYRHHQLKLETFERSQRKSVATFTCLSLSLDTPENDSLASCEDASLQDSMSLLHPASPDSLMKDAELKGYILARTVEQTVSLCYVQEDIENDPEYLGDVLDLLSNLVDACSALVASRGEALPFLKDTVARHYHKSVAAELLRAIGRNTTARFEERAAQVVCASCLTRYKEHKVLLESLEYLSYYGCRNCGQSREFLEGRIIAVLDSRMATERVQQNRTWRVNWLARQTLFDFDEVEILRATDEDVERLVCQVINDTDEFRRSRYKGMPYTIASGCRLFENSRKILQTAFG